MDRRQFLRACLGGAVALAVPTTAYSFLGGILRRPADATLFVEYLSGAGDNWVHHHQRFELIRRMRDVTSSLIFDARGPIYETRNGEVVPMDGMRKVSLTSNTPGGGIWKSAALPIYVDDRTLIQSYGQEYHYDPVIARYLKHDY